MKYRQLSVLICNVWLTQQTISGGWSTRAGPPVWSPYAWRLFSFTLQRALHQPGSHPGVPYFSFFVPFLEKKKKKEIHVIFVFSPRADIIAEEFVNGCKCEFQSQSNVFDCFKYYKVKCIWRNIYGSTRRVNNMTVFRHCMHSNQ